MQSSSSISKKPAVNKPYLQLHLFVIIVAFTAVLGHLISLPATTLVVWRTGIAALFLLVWLRTKINHAANMAFRSRSIMTGIILGLHWMTFFGAVKLSNISICLTGMATTSLFTAATEAIAEKRRPYPHELLLALLIIPAIIMIAGVEPGHLTGLLCAIVSACLAAIFPVINKSMVRQGAKPEVITYYEMIGAFVTCLLVSLCISQDLTDYIPTGLDWLWLGVLAIICTVYAFSMYINLLKTFSAYETSLAINFEPVYGILLAVILFNEHEHLHPLLFVGAAVILVVNILNPTFQKRHKESAESASSVNLKS